MPYEQEQLQTWINLLQLVHTNKVTSYLNASRDTPGHRLWSMEEDTQT